MERILLFMLVFAQCVYELNHEEKQTPHCIMSCRGEFLI